VEIVEQSGILFPLIFLFTSLYISSAPSVSFLQAVGKERVIREVSIIQTVLFVIASILLYPTVGFSIFPILLSAIYGVFLLTTLYYSYKELK